MKLFYGALFMTTGFLTLLSPLLGQAQRPRGHANPSTSNAGLESKKGCFEIKDIKEQEKLTELDQKLAQLHVDIGSTPEVYEKQARALIESTIEALSPEARQSLHAQHLMSQTAERMRVLQADPKVLESFLELEKSAVASHQAARKLSEAGAFTAIPRQNTANESTAEVLSRYKKFVDVIDDSKFLSESTKKDLRHAGRKMSQKTTKSVGQAIDMSHENIEVQKEFTGGVRDTSFGAALAVGGVLLTGGSASGSGVGLAASGTARLGATALSLMKGAAGGAAISGGTRLVSGNAGNFIRALSSEENLFCDLAKENAQNRALLYDEAASAAARGAIFGGIFASGNLAFQNGWSYTDGITRSVIGKAGLIGETWNSANREFDRSTPIMTRLSEARASTDPLLKAQALSNAFSLNGKQGVWLTSKNSQKDIENIASYVQRHGKDLGPEDARELNSVLDGLLVGLSNEGAFNLDRFRGTSVENAGWAGEGLVVFGSNLGSSAEKFLSAPLKTNRWQTEAAFKKVRTILGDAE